MNDFKVGRFFGTLLAGVLISGCGQPQSENQGALQIRDLINPPATSILNCNSSAQYGLLFNAIWSAGTHPTDFPGNAHFSTPVGLTHNSSFSLWNDGTLSSPGVRAVAEFGDTRIIIPEIAGGMAALSGENLILFNSGTRSPGAISTSLTVSKDYPLVSIVTMIAPSTNWFAGLNGVNLCQNGNWVNSLEVFVYPYTAGADSGSTFLSPRIELTPHSPISLIQSDPFLLNGNLNPVGSFYFSRI